MMNRQLHIATDPLHQPLLMPSTPGVGCMADTLTGVDDGAAGNAAVHPRLRLA